ncbi:YlxR family protein [bacterium]|nr:YlxR family protein [bacterium]
MTDRKCAGCGKIKNRDEMIRITKDFSTGDVFVNNDSKKFGRSVYLCYNKMCIENAFKKNKINKVLKAPIPEELKGKLINEF